MKLKCAKITDLKKEFDFFALHHDVFDQELSHAGTLIKSTGTEGQRSYEVESYIVSLSHDQSGQGQH